jgi:putative addiction module component (TIGR02574 family)
MVSPVLQEAVLALSPDEQAELRDFIDHALDPDPVEVSDADRAVLRGRRAQMEADPTLGYSADELEARWKERWG